METYRYTNDDNKTDSDIVGAVLEREAAESDDYSSHIVQPYRFEMPDDVDSAIVADDAN